MSFLSDQFESPGPNMDHNNRINYRLVTEMHKLGVIGKYLEPGKGMPYTRRPWVDVLGYFEMRPTT